MGQDKSRRFCGAQVRSKKGKIVSCTRPMKLSDRHSKCGKCRGGDCASYPCSECAQWSPASRQAFIDNLNVPLSPSGRRKSRKSGSFLDQEGDDGCLLDPVGLLNPLCSGASPLSASGQAESATLASHAPLPQVSLSDPGGDAPSALSVATDTPPLPSCSVIRSLTGRRGMARVARG